MSNTSKSPLTILVTAIGSMSAACVLTSLRAYPNARLIGSDLNPSEWIPNSELVDVFYQLPSARSVDGYVEKLLAVCQRECVSMLFVLTDPEVDAVNSCRELFEAIGVTVCLPSAACVDVCRDKWVLFEVFACDPLVKPIPTARLFQRDSMVGIYPLLAKPRNGRSSEGVLKLFNESDVEYLLSRNESKGYIVQPLLNGYVHVVDVVRDSVSGQCASVSRMELIRTSNGAGLTVRLNACAELRRQAEWIAQKLDVNGCICIEFFESEGVYFLMDINPRFSAGVTFSRLAGYDMALNALRCFVKQEVDCSIDYPELILARAYTEKVMRVVGE